MNGKYPSLLNPTDIEIFILNGKPVEIPKVILTFKEWKGTPIANTFGGKPLIDFDGVPIFAELVIMKLFKISGWQARWIETYGAKVTMPFYLSNWTDGKLLAQPIDLIQDDKINIILNEISAINGNSYSGCWDAFGWHNNRMIFAETKRIKKDRIRETQNRWLTAGLNYGLSLDNFLIVQWDFIN
jgi:hypothetical protein